MSMPEDNQPENGLPEKEVTSDELLDTTGTGEESGDDTSAENAASEEQDPETVIADLKDRLLRSIADMENLRNRSRREQEDALKYANTNFARDVLNVSDNLRRALESVPEGAEAENEALKTLRDGIDMTERELLSVFERHGIEQISPMGEKFDHNAHQAMFKVPGANAEPGTIVQVVQTGYMLRDRLLRPAMVGVAAEVENNDGGGSTPKPEGVDTQA
jgi:molecular chaperone GrpE